ncbi:hypothetical protein PCE1_000363 [Barthelona sp. PCE]
MAWRCTGSSNEELVNNLWSSDIIHYKQVAEAMKAIDRAHFVTSSISSYADAPSSIGYGATISAPHMHAYFLDISWREMHKNEVSSILEVGSGSGYLCAAFAALFPTARVFGVDHIPDLVKRSSFVIESNYPDLQERVSIIEHDGRTGLENKSPFDIILVSAAVQQQFVIDALLDQLSEDGIMLIPEGETSFSQVFYLYKRHGNSFRKERLLGVVFIPLCSKQDQIGH